MNLDDDLLGTFLYDFSVKELVGAEVVALLEALVSLDDNTVAGLVLRDLALVGDRGLDLTARLLAVVDKIVENCSAFDVHRAFASSTSDD